MCALLDASLAQGAAGLSTGLIYTPGSYAGTDEVVALAAVAARHGKPYVTHLRDEMSRVEEALEEVKREYLAATTTTTTKPFVANMLG